MTNDTVVTESICGGASEIRRLTSSELLKRQLSKAAAALNPLRLYILWTDRAKREAFYIFSFARFCHTHTHTHTILGAAVYFKGVRNCRCPDTKERSNGEKKNPSSFLFVIKACGTMAEVGVPRGNLCVCAREEQPREKKK